MKTSVKGRVAAVEGDTKAAVANRSALLEDIGALRSHATDARLKAGLARFAAAIREALRQNRECGERCAASELSAVNRLKQRAVAALNPLLRRYAGTSYGSRDI